MANSTTLTFAGDADSLRRATQQSTEGLNDVSDAANEARDDMAGASSSGSNLTEKMGHLGSAVDGASTAVDNIGASIQALADIQSMAANKAARQARLEADVEQARLDGAQAAEDLKQANLDLTQSYLDGEQARIDGKQAAIDIKQAQLDATVATEEYNAAVKEHGKNSAEARQAAIDLEQANADLEQAQLDQNQAQQDANQYLADGRQATLDASQAVRDGKDAQLDLNDALKEANPSALQEVANSMQLLTPILTAVIGVMGLVTAAQWVWNASLLASPVTWIVIGIIALVAVIVLIATKTTWFQDIWRVTWSFIKDTALAVGRWFRDELWGVYIKGTWDGIVAGFQWVWKQLQAGWDGIKKGAGALVDFLGAIPGAIGTAFKSITNFIFAPFKAAFNMVADAWNNTIGKLSWTVPSWVPFVGGNSISAPKLPKYHTGTIVSGALGSESLAILQAGEKVTGGRNASNERVTTLNSSGSALDDFILDSVRRAVGLRGGDPVRVLGNTEG